MNKMGLVIYGAQAIALGACEAIQHLYPERKISGFLVTERGEKNPKMLSGLPVFETASFAAGISGDEKRKIEVLIATPEDVMSEIEELLDHYGLFCHARLTSNRFSQLMSFYYASQKKFLPLSSLPIGCHQANLHVFMAKFYKDRPLTAEYQMPDWMIPIQAGASLCTERIAELLDCDGENISKKNGNYAELTVLYWIWKNRLMDSSFDDATEYYGLNHYRRILDLSEDDRLRLVDNEIDVVLPYPMPYEPDIEAHHKRYLKEEDWQTVLTALREIHPDDAEKLPLVLKQKYFYNYNLIIAHKRVLAAYCGWLFPVLERMEQLGGLRNSDRKDKCIGYTGETLTTLYFLLNKDKLNIKHSGCKFLV